MILNRSNLSSTGNVDKPLDSNGPKSILTFDQMIEKRDYIGALTVFEVKSLIRTKANSLNCRTVWCQQVTFRSGTLERLLSVSIGRVQESDRNLWKTKDTFEQQSTWKHHESRFVIVRCVLPILRRRSIRRESGRIVRWTIQIPGQSFVSLPEFESKFQKRFDHFDSKQTFERNNLFLKNKFND